MAASRTAASEISRASRFMTRDVIQIKPPSEPRKSVIKGDKNRTQSTRPTRSSHIR